MAGDWIPITIDLSRRREVAIIADKLGRSTQEIVGFLCEFWGWASGETENGKIVGYNVSMACATLSHPKAFYDVMVEVGWIKQDAKAMEIVNWDRWLSESAKARLGNRFRQRLCRKNKKKSVGYNVAKMSRLQNSTVQNSKPPPPPTPSHSNGDGGDGGEIDWNKAKATANTICKRLQTAAPPAGKYRRMIIQVAHLSETMDENWLDDAIEDTLRAKPTKPWAYFRKCLGSGCEAVGLDLEPMLARLKVPAQFNSKPR